MSIFNGDSIYKSGGGGGGGAYTPGGTLEDDDFIRVENNTISDYENTNRATLNFYIEPGDGEVVNALVELKNDTAATVNIFLLQNGLFTPMSYVGSNTVSANEEYSISISGNSFTIQQKTVPAGVPEYAEVGYLGIMPICIIGNLMWTAEDYMDAFWDYDAALNYNLNIKNSGWRLPTIQDIDYMSSYLQPNSLSKVKNTVNWSAGYEGTNETGFSANGVGRYYKPNNTIQQLGQMWVAWCQNTYDNHNAVQFAAINANPIEHLYYNANQFKLRIRFCKDIS